MLATKWCGVRGWWARQGFLWTRVCGYNADTFIFYVYATVHASWISQWINWLKAHPIQFYSPTVTWFLISPRARVFSPLHHRYFVIQNLQILYAYSQNICIYKPNIFNVFGLYFWMHNISICVYRAWVFRHSHPNHVEILMCKSNRIRCKIVFHVLWEKFVLTVLTCGIHASFIRSSWYPGCNGGASCARL